MSHEGGAVLGSLHTVMATKGKDNAWTRIAGNAEALTVLVQEINKAISSGEDVWFKLPGRHGDCIVLIQREDGEPELFGPYRPDNIERRTHA